VINGFVAPPLMVRILLAVLTLQLVLRGAPGVVVTIVPVRLER
jgi:hypothetical protein